MNHDSDKTMMLSQTQGLGPGPEAQAIHVLPKGTRLGEFEVIDLIGEGGFGAVYLAYDHSLDRQVALKEYMPTGLATRTTNYCVTVRSQANAATFNAGLKSFINEAKMLARFDSPSLVKVHRFWEANGTAYMVMPYYEGQTLKQALRDRRIRPDEPWLRMLLADLFDAIDTIHRANCYHRDIAPDNILLLKDGRPLLLDFGAARRVIGDLTQCLTVILKPGFAPIEQYADIAGLRQGPWTDIYALAAVVYFLICGVAPPPAVARVVHDEMLPARKAGKGRFSDGFLEVIDKALSVKPEQRHQSIAELRAALDAVAQVPPTATRLRTAAQQPVRREPWIDEAGGQRTMKAPGAEDDTSAARPRRVVPASPVSQTWRAPPEPVTPRRPLTKWMLGGAMLAAGIGSGLAVGNWLAQSVHEDRAPAIAAMSEPSAPVAPGAIAPPAVPRESPQRRAESARPAPPPPPAARSSAQSTPQPAEHRPAAAARVLQEEKPAPVVRAPQEEKPAPAVRAAQAEKPVPAPAAAADTPPLREPETIAPPSRRAAEPPRARREAETETAATPEPRQAARQRPADPRPAPSAEESLWDLAVALNAAPAFESYLERYPRGRFAALARDRLASLNPSAAQTSGDSGPASEEAVAPTPAPQSRPAPPALPMERQASIRMDTPPVAAPPRTEPEAPAPAPQGERRTLVLADQTLSGDFSTDPATGTISGTGRIVWKDGNQFEGTLVRGIKQGKGSFTWKNGQRYVGDWARDVPNGRGTITYPNGNRYEGEIRDGFPHGDGTIRYADGDTYKGDWLRGKSHGQGRYTWRNGSYWEGEFRDDRRTDNGKMVFSEEALKAAQAKR
ncbi:serine/threonine-protein kinase [Noviherbaspirillum aridicola]|uniref:non-specific serine/threonine protein kinase n=1 Tax=Noviherbaspirillum aridicola TaxID=2849687 RepID=A0ABQ4Q9Y7_9BURK|nr:serine/threonine-protein kinase [Noviherbaspirillum aridicola]GIZ53692.1 hypothetical protein NCCP691_37060 [Noviherbaspirillum aridicola]